MVRSLQRTGLVPVNILPLVLVLAAGALAPSVARGWDGSFQFDAGAIAPEPDFRDGSRYDRIGIRDRSSRQPVDVLYSRQLGEPNLPCWVFTIVIPQGKRVAGIDATPRRTVEIPGQFNVIPAQQPVPVSQARLPDFVAPDLAVYASSAAYPSALAEVSPVGIKSGFRLVTVTLNPLRYHPAAGRLELVTDLDIEVRYEDDPTARTEALSERQLAVFGSAVRSLVYNPRDVRRFAPRRRMTDFGNIDCVIITSSTLASHFQQLVDWHNKKGYRTEVRTTTWIYTNYSGRDNQEKIRNFVRDYYTNQGLMWVILGGDNAVVPNRQARAYVSGETGNIPCDLYYVDLQWSWDGDGDSIFGEAGDDTVDLYYDLYVGRASVDNATECSTFTRKVIRHETNPPTDYLRRILLVDALLWTGYDETQSNDSIAAITPSGWSDVFFHSPTTTTAVRDSLNHGFQFCHMVGHGNELGVYNGGTRIYGTTVIPGHNNGPRVNLLNSIACYTANFEYSDCCAEMAHNVDSGGSVAVLMNSRYGWGVPSSGVVGPSEKLDIRFYDYFFNHDTMPIGLTHAASKEVYRATALSQQVWRWCYYELMVFGDPLLMMYENVPASMSLSFTSPIGTGPQNYTVTVSSGGSPVNRALVCLSKGSEVYERGFTNSSGQVTLAINPTSSGFLNIFATAADHLPAEDSAQVTVGQTDVGVSRLIAPSGTVNLGTVVTPRATIRNFGTMTATSFDVIMRVGTGYADTVGVDSLRPSDTIQLAFANWTASSAGSHAVACTTRLTNDQSNSNDKQTGTVFVQTLDVSCVSIQQPTGTVSRDTVISPQATFRNNGNTTQTFDALFKISTGYADTQTITLDPSETRQVSFANWTASAIGTFTTACSTRLAGDMQNSNDKATGSVLVEGLDARAVSIVQPSGTVNRGDTVAPQAVVRNNGNTSQTFPVEFRIASTYVDTQSVTLGAGAQTTVTFADWVATTGGTFATACTTMLTGDDDSTNNKVTGSVFVQVLDAQAVQVLQPSGTIPYGSVIAPQATVRNAGNTSQTFDVLFRIADGYSDTTSVTLGAGAQTTVTFANWTANSGGTFQTACSTRLDGDMDNLGDRVTGAVFIQLTDVTCELIVSPTGTRDSTATCPVQARFRNNGNSTQSFDAVFRIIGSTSYYDTATISNLMSGEQRLVMFEYWTVGPRGTYATACSTRLTGDQVNSNDKATGSVTIGFRDAAAVAILSPTGLVDTASTQPVRAVIANNGTSTASIGVNVKVGTGYNQTLTRSVAAGAVDTVPFTDWTVALGRGFWPVVCSTWTAGDSNPANDVVRDSVQVRVLDVACTQLLGPPAQVDSGQQFVPQANVSNPGSHAASFQVGFTITDGYASLRTVNLDPGAIQTVSFDTWTAGVPGVYATKCSTELSGDARTFNDFQTGSVAISGTDVAVLAITSPPASMDPGTVTPTALVCNLSTGPRTFDAFMTIATASDSVVYADSVQVTGLGPDSVTTVAFADWTGLAGNYHIVCHVEAYADRNPSNDTAELDCRVSFHDVGAEAILSPSRVMRPMTINPLVNVINYGNITESFWVHLVIDDSIATDVPIYEDSAEVLLLGPGGDRAARLPSWTAELGRYTVRSWTSLQTDADPSNDSAGSDVLVTSGALGWQQKPDIPLGGRPVRHGGCMTGLDADGPRLYALKGYKTLEFYSFDVEANSWSRLADMPMGPSGRPVKYGADVCADGERYLYALKGNRTNEFWRFDIMTGEWTQMKDVPGYYVKYGSGVDFVHRPDGGYVYCVKASKTREFWAYRVATDTWVTRAEMPIGDGRPYKKGTAICTDTDNRMYVIKSRTNQFFAYDVEADTWSMRPAMPLYGYNGRRAKAKDGCDLTSDGNGNIYAFSGGNREYFFAYTEVERGWGELAPLPRDPSRRKVKHGGSLQYLARQVWALKGNKTYEFWVYTPDTMVFGRQEPERMMPQRSGVALGGVVPASGAGFIVRPNPVTGRVLTIENRSEVTAKAEVVAVDGRVVRETRLLPHRLQRLGLEGLAAGTYFVRLRSGDVVDTRKVVIE